MVTMTPTEGDMVDLVGCGIFFKRICSHDAL